ncbi:MAG: hypothetical protein ABJN26_02500 [Stappiaceae bacterium]
MHSFAMRAWVGAVVLFVLLLLFSSFALTLPVNDRSATELSLAQPTQNWEDQYFCEALLWPEQDDQCDVQQMVSNNAVTHSFFEVNEFFKKLYAEFRGTSGSKPIL